MPILETESRSDFVGLAEESDAVLDEEVILSQPEVILDSRSVATLELKDLLAGGGVLRPVGA
mgnify:CR=1 FL=1|jgi:hypothetical protein